MGDVYGAGYGESSQPNVGIILGQSTINSTRGCLQDLTTSVNSLKSNAESLKALCDNNEFFQSFARITPKGESYKQFLNDLVVKMTNFSEVFTSAINNTNGILNDQEIKQKEVFNAFNPGGN